MKMFAILLIMLVVGAGSASASGLEYRSWSGFTNPKVFQLTFDSPKTAWGLRAWGAFGQDDPAPWWDNSWYGLDLTHRIGPRARAYLGYEYLRRSLQSGPEPRAVLAPINVHQGFRVGLMGTVPLWSRFEAVYDVAYMPTDQVTVNQFSGIGTGRMYQIGLRYRLDGLYIEAGHWDWAFLAPSFPLGADHRWQGPYLSVGWSR